ncbi:PREDICTED: uncharacterized protein LOC104608006 [Nelumbo nucifera]|uniref:Uncharacterized protein LOC104608006 n=2 Tax=Nelumbo nucifera TaxID=4432 RepID=A0A1U8AVH6_NELNU|nr:PREDICTED: uncharacterized protein LOC104608006 [Nelumbo nucifera]DAD31096.1 TPA_asm: hypothetical protein HUJ06_009947 [Nelumbo nucifera]
MEEAEKMAALKKAYADIILNTAKEAAARIMVSERKALQFQQDLFVAKEEALNMLLRLKQLMNSKIAEAEKTSLSQRKRIEELELQLHQAEDTVRDLRAEMKRVQDELQKVKNNQLQPLSEEVIERNAVSHEDLSQKKKLSTSDSILCSPFEPGLQSASTNDTRSTTLGQRSTDERCCLALENATAQAEPSIDSRVEKYYAGNPDLASIIMRSKEPELYRNGCTQRIRAFERNLLDGKLPLPRQRDNQFSDMKNELIVREDGKVEETCVVASPKAENIMDKNPTESELIQHDSSFVKDDIKFFHRFKRRRRKARYRKGTSCKFLSDKATEASEASLLSCPETHPCPANANVESVEDPSKVIECEDQKDLGSHMAHTSPPNTTDMDPQSGCVDGTESQHENIQNATNKDTEMGETASTSQGSKAAGVSGDPACNLNLETADIQLTNSDSKDGKTFETTGGAPTQVKDGLLKYTFRRKRKKESLMSHDENASLEKKNTSKRRARDNPSSAQEPQKSSLIIESSRDSRRLVQVARQLISLSEKRWW